MTRTGGGPRDVPRADNGTVTPEPLPGPGARRARLQYLVPTGRWGWALMSFPVAAAVFTLGVVVYLTGFLDPDSWSEYGEMVDEFGLAETVGDTIMRAVFSVVLAAYNCLPPLGLAALVAQTSRHLPKGMPVVALGCLVYSAATGWLFVDMLTSDSSTAGLGMLFFPVLLGGLLIPFAGAIALLRRFLPRRPSATPGGP